MYEVVSFSCESCAAEHEAVGQEDEEVCGEAKGDSEAVMEREEEPCAEVKDKAL